ncbi:hypothetical protein GQ43DRAFT_421781 [Delitschia confertaspora ATCC 74209]|uniref:Uncharacterized protein n=1 Tax=Delitschia confertaspora ATCC 74209 TaxID=1513339 RepID=A0A9P4JL75_9PLEO|nr:hypothetical protein GQ43DRAFT_421781 [Delitschia confertaspora ATCC 74209]
MERRNEDSTGNYSSVAEWLPAEKSSISAYQVLRDNSSHFKSKIPLLERKVRDELEKILQFRGQKNKEKSPENQELADASLAELEHMSLEDLTTYVKSEKARLNTVKNSLEEKRTKGLHKTSHKMAHFIQEFDRFLTGYAGIVNVIALADAQYGGVASVTLSLLFATVKMKIQDEETIVSALQQMSDRMPDFQVYQKIYIDKDLLSMLSDAYKDVILLAREAISFFQRSSMGRSIGSLGKPAKFERMELTMRDNFNRIRLKCEALLAKRVSELQGDVKRLEKAVEEMKAKEAMRSVEEMRSVLKLGNFLPDREKKNLISYREFLKAKFDKDRHRQKLTVQGFLEKSVGKRWKAPGSVVVVLSGMNEGGISTVAESWLSPVAVDLAQELLDQDRLVAFEMCDQESTPQSFLARIIYQLLEKNPAVVRNPKDWYKVTSSLSADQIDEEERDGRLQAALLHIVNLQTEPVFIILNRPDLSSSDSPKPFIKAMEDLAVKAKTEVKVLIIIRTEIWDVEENTPRRAAKGKSEGKETVLKMIRLDQHRLSHYGN